MREVMSVVVLAVAVAWLLNISHDLHRESRRSQAIESALSECPTVDRYRHAASR